MNPFERHGIGHLSPSSLNLFVASPGIWALRYLARNKDPGNGKMWRGTAVEAGYAAFLRTGKEGEACDVAVTTYWLNADENNARDAETEKDAELIDPMLSQAMLWTPPSALNATQIKVEYFIDDVPVPVMGYVDLAFEGLDVDLKTTTRLPSKPSDAHVRQVSLYRAARQRAGGLLYVTDKRHAFYEVDDEMMAGAMIELSDAAKKLSRLLGAFEKTDDILEALPIDWSDFRAPKRGAPVTASASADFTAVAL